MTAPVPLRSLNILQLAASHPQGYMGSIGNNRCTALFTVTSSVLFQEDGPLGLFNLVHPMILMLHFGAVQRQARELVQSATL
jgi:hypothetical protein